MSTPIETNTEQLQEVLQQVYNLPNRSGGSNSYDLIIPINALTMQSLTASDIGEIDYDAVAATKAKLTNGETVKVLIKGLVTMDSGDPYPANMFPTSVRMDYYGDVCVNFMLPLDAAYGVLYGVIRLGEDDVQTSSFLISHA